MHAHCYAEATACEEELEERMEVRKVLNISIRFQLALRRATFIQSTCALTIATFSTETTHLIGQSRKAHISVSLLQSITFDTPTSPIT